MNLNWEALFYITIVLLIFSQTVCFVLIRVLMNDRSKIDILQSQNIIIDKRLTALVQHMETQFDLRMKIIINVEHRISNVVQRVKVLEQLLDAPKPADVKKDPV